MNELQLTKVNGFWTAKYIGPHAQEIIDLFETDTLPTAYGVGMPFSTVALNLMALDNSVQVITEVAKRIKYFRG